MSIETPRKEYAEALPEWEKIDRVRKHKDLAQYLRTLTTTHVWQDREGNTSHGIVEDEIRQNEYAKNAVFYNITAYTIRGLLGTMFRKAPVFDPAGRLKYLLENCDGKGNGINQQARSLGAEVIANGRAGLWVNYPKTEGEVSVADEGRLFATIHRLCPQQIINWSTMSDGAKVKLSLVVFTFQHEEMVDYELTCETRIKELALDEDGKYYCQEWRKVEGEGDKREWIREGEPVVPTDKDGTPFDEIPFTFVGSENNDHEIDEPPMMDMVAINIAHYRNSADFEDSVFYAGQSQPYMVGVDETTYEMIQKHGIRVGSRVMMPVPEGGAFGFATPDANPVVRQAMIDKVEQMIGIGARFVTPGGGAKTAYEAESDREVSHSLLSTITENVANAYSRALTWVGRFMGADAPEYILDSDFSDVGATPQLLAAWVKSYLDGAVPQADYIEWMQRQGYFDPERDPEDIAAELNGDDEGAEDDGTAPVPEPEGAGGPDSELGED